MNVEIVGRALSTLPADDDHPYRTGPWRPQTTQQGQAGPIPDLVNRDFSAAVPGEKMVGDITYIPTWEGWVYLATVIDCATRKVAGWAMDDNYRTPLITAAALACSPCFSAR